MYPSLCPPDGDTSCDCRLSQDVAVGTVHDLVPSSRAPPAPVCLVPSNLEMSVITPRSRSTLHRSNSPVSESLSLAIFVVVLFGAQVFQERQWENRVPGPEFEFSPSWDPRGLRAGGHVPVVSAVRLPGAEVGGGGGGRHAREEPSLRLLCTGLPPRWPLGCSEAACSSHRNKCRYLCPPPPVCLPARVAAAFSHLLNLMCRNNGTE